MGCPAYLDEDNLHHVLIHSRGQENAPSTIASDLAQMYGLQKQRHLTMGSGYQAEIDYGTINALAEIPCIHYKIERHALSSAHNDNHDLDKLNFQLDLIQAAGSMTAELHDVIAELTEKSGTFTAEQKLKFVTAIFNTYQLQQANDGRIELTSAQMEKLALETLDIMTDLARDVILPQGLKDIATKTIRETAEKFGLDIVAERLARFEKEPSAAAILQQSLDG